MQDRTARRVTPKVKRGYRFSEVWLAQLREMGNALKKDDTAIIEQAVDELYKRWKHKSKKEGLI